MLRDYQRRAIDQLYDWFAACAGNPCLVLPTGSGKSHIVAALCKEALQEWPETRVLMLSHVKEILEQNAAKMREHWPGAPLGIYSASIGKKQLGEPITFAGIQSVRQRAGQIGHIDLCIIDECHLVSHKDEGGYRNLLADLLAINPAMRVIGLTATPYRLGHGYITDKPALFNELLEPVTIEELIFKGHLATLRSKMTTARFDLSSVHKRGGEWVESELQAAVDTADNNSAVVNEIAALGADRKHWLLFCTGVDHAQHIADTLNTLNIAAACVTGATPKAERERLLAAFKAGEIRALTNCEVLTTGFDFPGIDLIAMLRPTMSAALYVQMAGRGMRPCEGKVNCLVLDFAGVVATHGPITAVQPPRKAGKGEGGEAPVKVCEADVDGGICGELCHPTVKVCPACGTPFPLPIAKPLALHNDDIMGIEPKELAVTSWRWRKHTSSASGKDMLTVTYYGGLSDPHVKEYLTVAHEGYAGDKAIATLSVIARSAKAQLRQGITLDGTAAIMNFATPPAMLRYKVDGKYHRILGRDWT